MDVSEAVDSRLSVREFLKDPVEDSLISELLEKASRSASGGNLQPWKIYVINNETMNSFHKFQSEWTDPETPAYSIYPEDLKEPYKTSRFEVGVDMYSILEIGRDDKEGRFKQMLKNYEFLELRLHSSVLQTDRWVDLNGLIWECSSKHLCYWPENRVLILVLKRLGP